MIRDGAQRARMPRVASRVSCAGTPAYMPPEQANDDVEAMDERADVFGLGSILCEILTGRPAYTGQSSDAIMRKAKRGDTADALATARRLRGRRGADRPGQATVWPPIPRSAARGRRGGPADDGLLRGSSGSVEES